MIERLKALQSGKGQFASGGKLSEHLKTNKALRKEIEQLSKALLYKEVRGCGNCYADAYLELISLNLEKVKKSMECKFKLRKGALLRDVINHDMKLLCTQANITDELALYHLRTNPNCKKFFEVLPDNLDELLAEAGEFKIDEKKDGSISELATKKIEELEELVQDLRDTIMERDSEISKLKLELEEKDAEEEYIDDEYLSLNDLNRDELIDFIDVSKHDIVVTDDMSDEDIRLKIIECEKAILSEEIDEVTEKLPEGSVTVHVNLNEVAKSNFIKEIAELLKNGSTKAEIKEKYKSVQAVGDVNLTVRALADFIKEAEALNGTVQ